MTHTTTDAAEARARIIPQAWIDRASQIEAAANDLVSWVNTAIQRAQEGSGRLYAANIEQCETAVERVLEAINLPEPPLPLATAEAASGAGEREGVRAAILDHLQSAFAGAVFINSYHENGHAMTEEVDACADLTGLVDDLAALASLPPATDPAMVLELAKARKSIEILRRALAWHGDRQRMATTREHWQQEIDAAIQWVNENPEPDYPSFSTLAALAAAPTIPATGEAIPAGMKPWHGGDAAPNDLDLSGRVLREDGQTEVGRDVTIQQWKRPVPRCKWNIIAYTPKATIPATGHAATEGEGA